MGQVIIPLTPVVNPAEVADNSDWNEQIESNRFPDGQFDLEGDYPRSGPGQQAGNGGYVNSSNIPNLDTTIEPGPLPEGPGWEKLDALLKNVLTQDWRERGAQGNPRILECYKVCGNSYTRDSSSMAYAWCAAFVSWALYTAGIPTLQTMSSQGWYNWGSEVDWRDTSQIRKWDVVIFKSKKRSGGHIGFIQEITSNGVIKVLGGNQGNNAKVSNYSFNSKSQYVRAIKRNWSLPPEEDKPIDGTSPVTPGSDTTT